MNENLRDTTNQMHPTNNEIDNKEQYLLKYMQNINHFDIYILGIIVSLKVAKVILVMFMLKFNLVFFN